MTVSFS